MSKKVNGTLAIYYGVGGLLTGVGGMGAFIYLMVKDFVQSQHFHWGHLLLAFFMLLIAVGGYALVRVGREELND